MRWTAAFVGRWGCRLSSLLLLRLVRPAVSFHFPFSGCRVRGSAVTATKHRGNERAGTGWAGTPGDKGREDGEHRLALMLSLECSNAGVGRLGLIDRSRVSPNSRHLMNTSVPPPTSPLLISNLYRTSSGISHISSGISSIFVPYKGRITHSHWVMSQLATAEENTKSAGSAEPTSRPLWADSLADRSSWAGGMTLTHVAPSGEQTPRYRSPGQRGRPQRPRPRTGDTHGLNQPP